MFYQKVKALCDERGMTIQKLEQTAGIGNGTIGKLKDGGYPKLTTVEKVAKALEIDANILLKAIME